jgi:hypothetical protein
MAKTIGQLTQATTLASGDEFVIEQSGLTKRVAASVVRGGLVNADIDAAAAIAFSKLAALDSANILVGNGSNVATKVAVTGDVTISNAGVTAIGSSKVVTAMITDANVTAAKLSGAQTGSAPIYGCRAWVNFDGTRNAADTGASTNGANVKIRASGNVSSVLKNGTGDYTITFTTAMQDANYAAMLSGGSQAATQGRGFMEQHDSVLRSTTQLRVYSLTDTTSAVADSAVYSVSIFR